MAADFPTSLAAIQRVLPGDFMDAPGTEIDLLHNQICDELEALQAKVGIDGSAVPTSIESRLSSLTDSSVQKTRLLDEFELRRSMQRPSFSGKILKDGSSTTGWSTTAGITLSAVAKPSGGPAEYRTNQGTVLRIATTTLNASITIGSLSTGPVGTPRVDVWVYIEDHASITQVSFYFATNSSFTDYYLKTITTFSHNGWQLMSMDLSVGSPTGSPTYETITNFRMLVTAASEAGTSLIFDRAVITPGGRTKCALIFDDGNTSDYNFALPILNKYGLIANFALIASVSPLEQFKTMAWSGHRMIVHGANDLTAMATMQDVENDIASNRLWVQQLGGCGDDSDVYVYPYGNYLRSPGNTMEIPALLESMGFKGAFTVGNQRITPARGVDRYILRRMEVTASTVAATLLATVDQLVVGGWSCALMLHKIFSSGATGYDINRQVFDDISAGLRQREDSGKLEVCTARDLISWVSPD